MTIFFTGNSGVENRGRVQVMQQPGISQMDIVTVEGWGGFTDFKSIITNITITEQGNHQFLHTLGDEIYVYVFGDRIGSFGVSGLSFYDNCGSAAGSKIGISHVIDYYRKARLSRNAVPLSITIQPGQVFRCFLTSMRGEVRDASRRMFQFHLGLALIPESRGTRGKKRSKKEEEEELIKQKKRKEKRERERCEKYCSGRYKKQWCYDDDSPCDPVVPGPRQV